MSKATKIVAEICFYGTTETGAGWLAIMQNGTMKGTGTPVKCRNWTTALFDACLTLSEAGAEDGMVRVFSPDGQRVATTRLNQPCWFGQLVWSAAPVYTISAEEIEKHAVAR